MGIAATGLELKESEDDIQMKVDYALDMNEEHVADCYLTVQAQSKDSDEFVFFFLLLPFGCGFCICFCPFNIRSSSSWR